MADTTVTSCTFHSSISSSSVTYSGQATVTLGDSVGAGNLNVYCNYDENIVKKDGTTGHWTGNLSGRTTVAACQSGTVTVELDPWTRSTSNVQSATMTQRDGSTASHNSYSAYASFNTEGQGSVSRYSASATKCGEVMSCTATPYECYKFIGWYKDGVQVSTSPTLSITTDADTPSSQSFTAKFTDTPEQYTVTASASPAGGGTVSPSSRTVQCNYYAAFSATPADCYEIDHWVADGTTYTGSSINFKPTGNTTAVCYFRKKQFTVTGAVSPDGGGTVSGGGTKDCGTTVTLTATPNSCYKFSSWSGAPAGATVSGNKITFTVSGNTTVTANFTKIYYYLSASASPSAGGYASAPYSVECGKTATLTATPNSCYNFSYWRSNKGTTKYDASFTYTPTADETWTAYFTLKSFVISAVSANPGRGSVSGGGSKSCGSSYTLTATPNAGYRFVNWTASDGSRSTSNPLTATCSEAITWTAHFDCQDADIGSSCGACEPGTVQEDCTCSGKGPGDSCTDGEGRSGHYAADCSCDTCGAGKKRCASTGMCYSEGQEYCKECIGGCWDGTNCHQDDEYDCVNCKHNCWYKGVCRVPGEATCGCNNEGTLQSDCSCNHPEVGDSCGECVSGTIRSDCTCSGKNPGDSCTDGSGEQGTYKSDCSCDTCGAGKKRCASTGMCYSEGQEYCESCTGGTWCDNQCCTTDQCECEHCTHGQWCAKDSSCSLTDEDYCENCIGGTWCAKDSSCSLTEQAHCEDCLGGCYEGGGCILESDDKEVWCACMDRYWCDKDSSCHTTFEARCTACGGCYKDGTCYETEGRAKCEDCEKRYWCETAQGGARCVDDEDSCCSASADSQRKCELCDHGKWCAEKSKCYQEGKEYCEKCRGGCYSKSGNCVTKADDGELKWCDCVEGVWCTHGSKPHCTTSKEMCCADWAGHEWCETRQACYASGKEYCYRCVEDGAPSKVWCPACESNPCQDSEKSCCECQSGKQYCEDDGGCYTTGRNYCAMCKNGCYLNGDCITDAQAKCENPQCTTNGRWCQNACRTSPQAQCKYCDEGETKCVIGDDCKHPGDDCTLVVENDGVVTSQCTCKCKIENEECIPTGCSAGDAGCKGHRDDKCNCHCDNYNQPCDYNNQGPGTGKLDANCKCICKDAGAVCTPEGAAGPYGRRDSDCKCECKAGEKCTDAAGRSGKVVNDGGACTCKCDDETEKAKCEAKVEINDNWAWVDQACECKCVKANQECDYEDANGNTQHGYVDPTTCECGHCKKSCASPSVFVEAECECKCPESLGPCPPGRHRDPNQGCECVCDEDGSGCDTTIQVYDKTNCKCKCIKGGERKSEGGQCYERDAETCNWEPYDPNCQSPHKQDENCGCDACISDDDCPTVEGIKWHRSLDKDCACTGCNEDADPCNDEQYRDEGDCKCHCKQPDKCGQYGEIQEDCSCKCDSLAEMGAPYNNGGYWEVTEDCKPYCPATVDCGDNKKLNPATCKCECEECTDPAKPDQKDDCSCYCNKSAHGGDDCKKWNGDTCSCDDCKKPCAASDCSNCKTGCQICDGCKTDDSCHCVDDPNGAWYGQRDAAANAAAQVLANAELALSSAGSAPTPYNITCSCCLDMDCINACVAESGTASTAYTTAANDFATALSSAQSAVDSIKTCVSSFDNLSCGDSLPSCSGDVSGVSTAYSALMSAYSSYMQVYAKYDGC